MESQQETKPLSQRHSYQSPALLLTVVIISTGIAIIWGLSDTGKIDEYWGKLALIFFTWLAIVLAAWALSHRKG